MPVRFGTDGIRGRANEEITVDLAYRLGRAVGSVFSAPVFVGYDTRESSPSLAAAVLAGLADEGADAVNLGYFTTPGVAVIAQQRGGVGVVVSASHNPFYDNGLKVLGLGGGKLDHATEEAVTAALNAASAAPRSTFDEPARDVTGERDYVAHLRELVPGDFSSLHLVIDCANGAASTVAERLFAGTGARLTMLHDQPDGRNINENCGSTNVASLVSAIDEAGLVRDGDDLMVLFSLDLALRDLLGGGLVVTSMSNLGLRQALVSHGIAIVETEVGDRNVLMALEEHSWPFGGEQSGHLIFRDIAPTGDGLLTGLLLCDLVVRRGPLSDQAVAAWQRVPQAIINVARDSYDDVAVRQIFDELSGFYRVEADDVRLVIRPSGTEPVIRVMIEGLNGDFVKEFTQRLQGFFHA